MAMDSGKREVSTVVAAGEIQRSWSRNHLGAKTGPRGLWEVST